jgi:protein TonB
MLISKFDLYKHEWLELVFENRNKGYGAYDLRQHYAGNMIRAMAITFSGITLLFGAGIVFNSHPRVVQHPVTEVVTPVIVTPQIVKPKTEPPAPKRLFKADPAPMATTRFVPPVVVEDQLAKDQMKKVDDLTGAIGTTDTKGKEGSNTPVVLGNDGPAVPTVDNSVHTLAGVDVMPEPIGGEAAWSKFLSRNLRYPEQAQDAHVSGKAFLSFVIEKDGHLSNIVVERAAGYGFDEEATRVLKLAKAWKPGMQNGQPVRVKYIIPINFQISE